MDGGEASFFRNNTDLLTIGLESSVAVDFVRVANKVGVVVVVVGERVAVGSDVASDAGTSEAPAVREAWLADGVAIAD